MKTPGILLTLLIIGTLFSCKKETAYQVNEVKVQPPNANKTKLKTEGQFVSILYANLFQEALSANELVEITDIIMSIGDKDLAHEMVISNFMNKPGVTVPDDQEMRSDIGQFVEDTYERFLVRPPSEAERTFFINFIESRPILSAEMVYFAFALCNEYLYY